MRLPPPVISDDDRAELERRVARTRLRPRAAQRARIILLAADGWSNRAIGERVGMHYKQVGLWRQRFEADGLAGLLDGDRPGRAPVYGHDDVLPLVKTVTEDPPDAATRWTMAALAERMAAEGVTISASRRGGSDDEAPQESANGTRHPDPSTEHRDCLEGSARRRGAEGVPVGTSGRAPRGPSPWNGSSLFLDAGCQPWHAFRIIAEDRHADRLAALRAAVFEADALTDQTDRAAAADGGELPVELGSFLTTVREASYRLTDADLAGLRAAGHTEEEIFELTIAAALT